MYFKYILDGSLVDHRRLNAKCLFKFVMKARVADDCAFLTLTEENLQLMLNSLSKPELFH